MTAYVFIPARFGSTRLPGKPLKKISGKPLIQWVFEGCMESKKASHVFIATDSLEIKQVAETFGSTVIMTSDTHKSGTDRIAEACGKIGCHDNDVIVNVQGDEPMVTGELIDILIDGFSGSSDFDMLTLGYFSSKIEEFTDPNVVKIVLDNNYRALYFSRASIPHFDKSAPKVMFWKHMGYYCYTYKFLKSFVNLPMGKLERIEKLEQLRALENGFSIGVIPAPFETIGVDTLRDIEVVAEILAKKVGARR